MNKVKKMESQLHGMLTDFVKNGPFPALAVGIVKDNQIIFTGEYGTANLSTGAPIDRSTLFHQASVSKTFVVTAIMQLVERGKVNLDSPIAIYLSYFKMEDERYQHITIRQLLNHTSGMPDEEDYAWDRPEYDEESLERYVKSISRHKLLSKPGMNFSYSNIAYEILGDLIAKVSGMSFEHYMKEHVLEPSGMHSSSFLKQEVEAHLAAPHVLRTTDGYGGYISDVFPYNRAHGPSSTLYTNVKDMCQYMLMHLNQGITKDGHHSLESGSYDEMWKPHAATEYGQQSAQVGLGWFLGEYKGCRIVSHSGWDTGFLSDLILLPDEKIAISVMTNCDYVWLGSVTYPLLDLLLGSNIHQIKRSMAHTVAELAVSNGVEKALEEYHRINSMEEDDYYVVDFEFMRITEALTWNGHKDEALSILTCAAAIFPDNESISRRVQELQKKTDFIEIVPYTPQWKTEFNKIKEMIHSYISDFIISIEHVGSTSVEGLSAKPIIDLDVVIENYTILPSIIERLNAHGFKHEGNFGIEGREAFKRTYEDGHMKYHLYVCPKDGKGYIEHIAFRDYLRANEESRKEYEELKKKLADKYRNDRDSYGNNKTEFIKRILEKAIVRGSDEAS